MDILEKKERRVTRLLQGILDNREPVLERMPAILGKSNAEGSATVPSLTTHCYLRVANDEAYTVAFNNRTEHTNGMPVTAGYEASQPDLFQVLTARHVYDASQSVAPSTGPHHASHEWGNSLGASDIVYARLRQILDCLVYARDPASLLVNMADGLFPVGNAQDYYPGGTVDLTSSVPSSGYRWAMIAMDEAGPYVVNSPEGGDDSYAGIPSATRPDHWRIAAVRLHSTTTAITDWPNTAMIVDLRFPGAGLGEWTGPRTLTVTEIDDTDSVYTVGDDDDVIVIDASSGAVTATLPALAGITGRRYQIKCIDSTNTVTIDGNGAQTIDGSATKTMVQYDALIVVAGSAEWHIM